MFLGFLSFSLASCKKEESPKPDLGVTAIYVGTTSINLSGNPTDGLPIDQTITVVFSAAVETNSANTSIVLKQAAQPVDVDISYFSGNTTVVLQPNHSLDYNTSYTINITDKLRGASGEKFPGMQVEFKTLAGNLEIISMKIGGQDITPGHKRTVDVPLDFSAIIAFSNPLDASTVAGSIKLTCPDASDLSFAYSNNNKTLTITRSAPLDYLSQYTLDISNMLKGADGETFPGQKVPFYSAADKMPKFPVIPDDELLTKVQQQTFQYFWDFAHPVSGLARERNTSGDVVTTGGSGFGIMAILVGIERGFISRAEGIARLTTIVDFLGKADRFHGAWPHWMNGATGKVIPFSTKDDGGDLVETAFMIQGLLTVRAIP